MPVLTTRSPATMCPASWSGFYWMDERDNQKVTDDRMTRRSLKNPGGPRYERRTRQPTLQARL